LSHQWVGFWTAFSDTRFGAFGTIGHDVFGKDLKEFVEEPVSRGLPEAALSVSVHWRSVSTEPLKLRRSMGTW
jgi:hypothetical protein